jgi:hypothetical protein
MLRRVALVRADVTGELSASFIRVTRICELGTTLTVTSNRRTLRADGVMCQLGRDHYHASCMHERTTSMEGESFTRVQASAA